MSEPRARRRRRALPKVAVEVLESLHQHRLLTVRQVHALHTPSTVPRWTHHILTELAAHGLADRVSGARREGLWFLTRSGAEAIRSAGTLTEPRIRATTPAQAAGPLRAHTLAVNDAGIAFVRAARERGDDCGPLSWRHEIAHPFRGRTRRDGMHLLIADALLSYLEAGDGDSLLLHQSFIELDRGTIPPEHLAGKLARYDQLSRYTPDTARGPLWQARYRAFPSVLVILADQTVEHARRRIAKTIALYRSDPLRGRDCGARIAFTTLDELTVRGPFAAIFLSAEQPDHYRPWIDSQTEPKR